MRCSQMSVRVSWEMRIEMMAGAAVTPRWREALRSMIEAGLSHHEARVLLEEASGRSFAELFIGLEEVMDPAAHHRLTALVSDRLAGVPLQHLVGLWPFRHLELVVDRRGLIPRPETEEVVGVALDELDRLAASRATKSGRRRPLLALDLGTGSGAIACSLVHENPQCWVLAIDRSTEALALCGVNLGRLVPEERHRIRLAQGSWFAPVAGIGNIAFDLVVANPPYLSRAEWSELEITVRDHDPYGALVAGETGIEDLAVIIAQAPNYLAPGGLLLCEIGASQGESCRELARRAGAKEAKIRQDLAGRDRMLLARFS